MSNVVYLKPYRDKQAALLEYKARILSMDKLALLEEMIKFQATMEKLGTLDVPMLDTGIFLFEQLERTSETKELLEVCRSFKRHLLSERADRTHPGKYALE